MVAVDGILHGAAGAAAGRVRGCGTQDAEVLGLVGAATFLESYAGWLPGKDIVAHCRLHHSRDAYAEMLARAGTQAWVSEVGDAPVGYLVMTAPEMPVDVVQEGDTELKRIYLLSRFQRMGHGDEMMQRALAWARQSGAGRVLVGMHRENVRAAAFYGRHGFAQIGTRQFTMGGGVYEDPVMALRLG